MDNKRGFTLLESLICMLLVGVIFTATISAFHKQDNYNELYWQAFNTLYQASKNYSDEVVNENSKCTCDNQCNINYYDQCYKSDCWRNSNHKKSDCKKQERTFPGGTNKIDRDFPGFLYNSNIYAALAGYGQNKEFCEKLTEKINVLPGGKCKSFISAVRTDLTDTKSEKGGVNFYKAFIANKNEEGSTIAYSDTEDIISPSFIAINGQKFYISDTVTANFQLNNASSSDYNHPSRETFRFVVVDLNGNSPPNSQFVTNGKNPDLVLFIINSRGDVIPLGLPEFSKQYINAMVYYPDDLNDDGSLVYPEIHSSAMTLWDAKKYAWGYTEEVLASPDVMLYANPASDEEPLSQSSRLYSTAIYCKSNTCSGKNIATTSAYADNLFVNLILQFIYKEDGSSDTIIPTGNNNSNIPVSEENGCKSISGVTIRPTCGIDFQHSN